MLARLAARLRPPPVAGAYPISTRDALDLIAAHGLVTVRESWHYTWEIERFFPFMWALERDGRLYVFSPEPYHKWAPAPLFTDDPAIDSVIATANPDRASYWFLKLTTFDDFLARRSALSRRRNAHFPTRESYPRTARKLNCRLERLPLFGNEDFFVTHFDRWKLQKYDFTGAKCIKVALAANRRAPRNWFQIYALRNKEDGHCRAVALTVQNGSTCSGFNTASEPGHGVFCQTEMIGELCERGFTSFECGAVGKYDYMTRIFLDAVAVGSAETLLGSRSSALRA